MGALPTENRFAIIRKFTKYGPETSVIFVALGFIISCSMNYFIFKEWGLEFLQVASPSDVLMSGLKMSGILLFPFFFAVFIGITLLGSGIFFPVFFQKFLKIKFTQKIWQGYAVVVIFFFCTWYIIQSINNKNINIMTLMSAIIVITLCIILMSSTIFEFYKNNFRFPDAILELFSLLFFLAIGLTGFITWYQEAIQDAVRSGVFGESFSATNINCGAVSNKVLWVGETSTIVKCLDKGNTIIVIRNGENLIIRAK
jgi:hypothetical protein